MKIEISRTTKGYTAKIDDVVITTQSTLVGLFHKMWKYAKGQGI